VRLARDHQGNLKKFAYVQFTSKDGMKKALLLDGQELRDNQTGQSAIMSVQVSCPPSDEDKRKAATGRRTRGGGGGDGSEHVVTKRGRSKSSMLSLQVGQPQNSSGAAAPLLPRALARSYTAAPVVAIANSNVTAVPITTTVTPTPVTQSSASSASSQASVGKSNADFRAMLLAGKK
jgi:hypothetical protein